MFALPIVYYILCQDVHHLLIKTEQGYSRRAPKRGHNIGCKYTKKCDCLEYAAVNESRITDPSMLAAYKHALATSGDTLCFSKKFLYFAKGTKIQRTDCLVSFYPNSRWKICCLILSLLNEAEKAQPSTSWEI